MMFELSEEHRMLRDLVAKFVDQELIPLESAALAREIGGERMGLAPDEESRLHDKCRELGLWGLDVPEQFGGANLPAVALMAINEELGRTAIPFFFPPDSPNLHMLMAACNEDQKQRYLLPYASGAAKSAIAISEPGAGGDPAGMTTRAVKDGGDWVINGRKIWVSRVPHVDFTILMARTGEGRRHEGISAFLVDKGTRGFHIEREIPMIGGQRTYELVFDNLRLPAAQLLGREGQGFAPMQLRLTIRRLQMGAWCTGMAVRALAMLIDHAKQRSTFGVKLSDRQAVQWWIADAATRIHACRLMLLHAASRQDAGHDIRTEASMIKVTATELAHDVLDHAMQAYGAMGMTRELPLQIMAQKVRTMRIYEGPSEVHRMVIARRLIADRK
jgi:acyl-CoA dehydrogenase